LNIKCQVDTIAWSDGIGSCIFPLLSLFQGSAFVP
jgi:hypothetical protein